MGPFKNSLPSAASALAFIAGGLLGSIVTQVILPGLDWRSCQQLGVISAARPRNPLQAPLSTSLEMLSDDKEYSEYRTARVNGTYNLHSPFTGPPSPEVDAAWERYWRMWMVSVDETAFRASQPQHSESAVRLEGGAHDGRYLATFGATHQLHCLYNLFRASYLDSYPDQRAEYGEDPRKWHERVDHCVEILRQKLECDRDTTLVTYNWVKHKKGPTANFNVLRVCPDWDAMDRWSQRYKVTEVQVPTKPPNAVELQVIP